MADDMMLKPLHWVGSSLRDFRAFPEAVKSHMGYALFLAQSGERHRKAKILKGMGDAGIIELVENHLGDTYRAVYTLRFASAIYVLHSFQKKSVSGIATPKADMQLIAQRLKDAQQFHEESGYGAVKP